jgi:hypothetical protein
MKIDVLDIPFDHFQRYGMAGMLLKILCPAPASVLEVGANEQRLLESFLPGANFIFSDLYPPTNADGSFIRASATSLPFGDAHFDSVVCLDVLEHMPPDQRTVAVREMARVASRIVIVACPLDRPWVRAAEKKANEIWRENFGEDYPWLQEHEEYGLVDGNAIEAAFIASGMKVQRFGQGNPELWSSLMGVHFLKEKVAELKPLVEDVDRLYNEAFFSSDRCIEGYREFFVGTIEEQDFIHVQSCIERPVIKHLAVERLLLSLPDKLRPVIDRIRTAEAQWENNAKMLREVQRGQEVATEGWRETVVNLREIQAVLEGVRGQLTVKGELLSEMEDKFIASERARVSADIMLLSERQRADELAGELVTERDRLRALKIALDAEASARLDANLSLNDLKLRIHRALLILYVAIAISILIFLFLNK